MKKCRVLSVRNTLLFLLIPYCMVELETFECSHTPKKHLMKFRCYKGDYSLALCSKCRTLESDEFLISEDRIP